MTIFRSCETALRLAAELDKENADLIAEQSAHIDTRDRLAAAERERDEAREDNKRLIQSADAYLMRLTDAERLLRDLDLCTACGAGIAHKIDAFLRASQTTQPTPLPNHTEATHDMGVPVEHSR